MQNNWKGLITTEPGKGSLRQYITSLHWQTMWQSATILLIGKESMCQPRTRIGQKEGSERPSASGRHGLTPSIAMRGATISWICTPSCYSLLPHLVVAVRSTEDDVWWDIEINLLVIISVLALIQNENVQSLYWFIVYIQWYCSVDCTNYDRSLGLFIRDSISTPQAAYSLDAHWCTELINLQCHHCPHYTILYLYGVKS